MKWLSFASALILAGCSAGPAPKIYVLTPPAEPVAHASSESGRPVLAVQRVSVPDYLDSTDIVSRDGQNELTVSPTGRWGERLSIGVTDALTADLERRLPGFQVTNATDSGPAARVLTVSVEALDMRSDGSCVLSVRWSVPPAAARRDTFVTQAARSSGGISDAAVATAMAAAIEQLADRISAAIARR